MIASGNAADRAQTILAAAERGDIQVVEEIWIELLADPPRDPEFYSGLCAALTRAKAKARSHELFALALDELATRGEWKAIDRIAGVLAPIWPDSAALRKHGEQALRGRYAGLDQIDAMIAQSKIVVEDEPVDRALKRFRLLLRLTPGQVYQHKTWGEGVVRSFDLSAGHIVIDFADKAGRVVTLDGVKNFLKYLRQSHFLAVRAREPERLRELARENPAALVKQALESNDGRLKQSALKIILTGGTIPEKSWNSWWTRARRELRHDPMVNIDPTGGAHAEIVMRSKPRTIGEEIETLFFDAEAGADSKQHAVDLLAQAPSAAVPKPELAARMLARLDEEIRLAREAPLIQRIEIALLADDIARIGGVVKKPSSIPTPEEALANLTDYEALGEVENVDHAVRALRLLLARDGEQGAMRAASLLPTAPVKLAQAIWKELQAERHRDLAAEAMIALLQDALANPDTYLWAIRTLLESGQEEFGEYFALAGIVLDLLKGIEIWNRLAEGNSKNMEGKEAAQKLVTRARSILSAKNYAALCSAVQSVPLEQAQRIRKAVQNNSALPDQFKAVASRQMRLTRRDLEDDRPISTEAREEAQAVYCTPRARVEMLAEVDQLRAVRIPENSKAIEVARAEGDLRENAGYHAAKDEQKILMQHLLQLQQTLSAAQVISAADVKADLVSFGTTFDMENLESGEVESYTLLGRWESDPDRRVLNIQAPLAREFAGRRVGEEIEVGRPDGARVRYAIRRIENALAAGEWDAPSRS